jgi:hypothetical protein
MVNHGLESRISNRQSCNKEGEPQKAENDGGCRRLLDNSNILLAVRTVSNTHRKVSPLALPTL